MSKLFPENSKQGQNSERLYYFASYSVNVKKKLGKSILKSNIFLFSKLVFGDV